MGLIRILKNRHQVLGLNARYLEYIRPNNLQEAFEIADDKVLTKKILNSADVPTPELIAVIGNFRELRKFDLDSLPDSFVIKPVHGIEGGGIEIFYNRKNGYWIKADKTKVSKDELRDHMREIINGQYSLYNQPDKVLIETRVKPHKDFRYYTYEGTPDVRVIVYNNIPVMSYVRLPTKKSQGRANLALGAIGAAIDIAEGKVTSAIIGKKGGIEHVPHTKIRLSGLQIPDWNKLLEYSVKAQKATKLGFAAVDFLIDRELGPLVVELNARPGLSIQLANEDGLRSRLERAKGIKVSSIQQGIRLGKDMFGGEIEETIENVSGKQLIGVIENVTIFGVNDEKITIKGKIDTGADSTSIDTETLRKLGYGELLDKYANFVDENMLGLDIVAMSREEASATADRLTELVKEQIPEIEKIVSVQSSHGASFRPYFKVKLQMQGVKFPALCSAYDRTNLKYAVIVGRKSLAKFLVDVLRTNY